MKKHWLGMLFLLIGIALFSTIEITQKRITQQCGTTLDPYMTVFVRMLVTGILLIAVGLPGFYRSGKHFCWTDFWVFLFNGFFAMTACLSLFHMAIDFFQNASSSAVVFSANAVFAIIFARFINHEPWTWAKWIAIVLGLGGISLFVLEKGVPEEGTLKAIYVMCAAAMLFAIGVCFTRRVVARYGAMVYMGFSALLGSVLTLPFFFCLSKRTFMEALQPMADAWQGMAFLVVVATAIAYIFYYTGIAYSSAFHASMAFMLKPVLACVLAYIASKTGYVTSETSMNVYTICGVILIVSAMCIAQFSKSQPIEAKGAQEAKEVKKA